MQQQFILLLFALFPGGRLVAAQNNRTVVINGITETGRTNKMGEYFKAGLLFFKTTSKFSGFRKPM